MREEKRKRAFPTPSPTRRPGPEEAPSPGTRSGFQTKLGYSFIEADAAHPSE